MNDCFNRLINDNDLCLRFTKYNYSLCVFRNEKFYDEFGNIVQPVNIYKIANPDINELKIKDSIIDKILKLEASKTNLNNYIREYKISAKNLQLGHAYISSKMELLIYLGKYKVTYLYLRKEYPINIMNLSIEDLHQFYIKYRLSNTEFFSENIYYCYISIYDNAFLYKKNSLINEDKYYLDNLVFHTNVISNYHDFSPIECFKTRKILIKHIDRYQVPIKDLFIHQIKHYRKIYIYERIK